MSNIGVRGFYLLTTKIKDTLLADENVNSVTTGDITKIDLAKQTIRSRDFVKHVSKFDDVLPSLMALKEYDPTSQSIIFDEEVYDSSNQKWISPLPSEYEVYNQNIDRLFM